MSHSISLDQAVTMTTKYRNEKDKALTTDYQGILSICESFDRSAIDTLLAETDCTKLRVYFGMDDNAKIHVIIVGVDTNDKDILPPVSATTNGEIVETGLICPPACPPSSPLNS
jgi:hypothetical protein